MLHYAAGSEGRAEVLPKGGTEAEAQRWEACTLLFSSLAPAVLVPTAHLGIFSSDGGRQQQQQQQP